MKFTIDVTAPTESVSSKGHVYALVGGDYHLHIDADIPSEAEEAVLTQDEAYARITVLGRRFCEQVRQIVEASVRSQRDRATDRARVMAAKDERKRLGLPEPAALMVPAGTKDPSKTVVVQR